MRWMIGVLLLTAALAGCTDGGDEEPHDHDDGTHGHDGMDGMDGTDGHTDGNGSANVAPTVVLTADNETVPVGSTVTFAWTAVDEDGDELSFRFDADGDGADDTMGALVADNGTYAPFEFAFGFTEVGAFNATLNLTDGTDSVARTLVISVTDAVTDGNVTGNATGQVAEGSWTLGAVACPHDAVGTFEGVPASALTPFNGVFWGGFEVDEATWGKSWSIMTESSAALLEIDFYDVDGAYIEYHSLDPGVEGTGKVPQNAGFAFVFPCGDGPGSFTYSAG